MKGRVDSWRVACLCGKNNGSKQVFKFLKIDFFHFYTLFVLDIRVVCIVKKVIFSV